MIYMPSIYHFLASQKACFWTHVSSSVNTLTLLIDMAVYSTMDLHPFGFLFSLVADFLIWMYLQKDFTLTQAS